MLPFLPFIPTAAAALTPPLLLLTPNAPSASLPACLQSAYHGTYAGESVYLPSNECASSASSFLDAGSIVPLSSHSDEAHLVWVGAAGIEGVGLRADVAAVWDVITTAATVSFADAAILAGQQSEQVAFSSPAHSPAVAPTLVHASQSGLFLSVPASTLGVLDTLLPRGYVPVGIPAEPLPFNYDIPVKYAEHLANVTKGLRFDPTVNEIVESISASQIRADVRWLTGEDSEIITRHSFTEGARIAAQWIKEKMETTGASCELFPFLEGFAPDVICEYPSVSDSEERVILSGHYDSRGSFGNTRAPGGDDDGSGSAHVLAVGHAIKEHGVKFDKKVTLCFFAGEEQGLWGSHYYAKHLAETNATVILQIQADMLAYRVPGEPLQLGLPATIELAEASYLVANLSALYAPELVVGRTAACCSDHQSFLSYNFPATQVFERNGWIADPMYHNSGDLSDREGYDFEQIQSIAKVTLAAVLEVGGWSQ